MIRPVNSAASSTGTFVSTALTEAHPLFYLLSEPYLAAKDYTLLDVGCNAGEALLHAHHMGVKNLIGVEPRTFDLPYVSMTNTQMKGTFIMSLILVPMLMAALGVAVWWRRR